MFANARRFLCVRSRCSNSTPLLGPFRFRAECLRRVYRPFVRLSVSLRCLPVCPEAIANMHAGEKGKKPKPTKNNDFCSAELNRFMRLLCREKTRGGELLDRAQTFETGFAFSGEAKPRENRPVRKGPLLCALRTILVPLLVPREKKIGTQ